ncbi:nitric oxide reductase activation protein [Nocardia sp. NPDC024068]|uniref:nitric oxide reductase activation protein NorD n=1 Tax=Nocardia sp. NPDC024068 TaxID=3157197 RepID=UPI0033C5FF27
MSEHSEDWDESAGLAMLASALAGRAVTIGQTGPGEPSWTDGRCVYLDPTESRREQRRSLALHSCLIGAGGLDPNVLRALGRRTGTAARYLTVEGHRALLAHAAVLPRDMLDLVDHEVAAMAVGTADSLAVASGRTRLPAPPGCFGILRARSVVPDDPPGSLGTGSHRPRSRSSRELDEPDDTGADDNVPDKFSSPIGGGGLLGGLLRKLLGASRGGGRNGHPGADSAGYRGRSGPRGAGAVTSSATAPAGTTRPGGHRSGAPTYPEWDIHRRRYRHHWCTVLETEPDPAPDPRLPHWDRQTLRQPLARLDTTPAPLRRQRQGDELDIDAVVESRVQIRTGSAPEEAVYLDTPRRRRDLSVLILLDISGSAAEPGGDGRPVHEHQRCAAAALAVTLHELGDRVALYGFRSQGRGAVHLLPVKRFDDPFALRARQRLHGLQPGAYSRLGAAIRHGTSVLRTGGGTSRRLLLVLSDGLAYDTGYDRGYGAADAHRALAEARGDGIGCVCLTVGAATGDAELAAVFGSAAHVTVPDTGHLAGVVGPLFRSALAAGCR